MPTPSTDSKITGEDWYGRQIGAGEHSRVAFIDVDMTEATTAGAMFTECSFRGVRFNASRHTSSAFINCSFHRCSFFDAAFTDCKLMGSTFERCDLSTLAVTGGDWSFVDTSGADLRGSDLTGINPLTVSLRGAVITWDQAVQVAESLGLDVRHDEA